MLSTLSVFSFYILSLLLSISPFFFLPLPPPPSSTLFPYTTLFRSLPPDILGLDYYPHSDWQLDMPGGKDRKSTRLNSSHRCISYAVLCLKKKNRNLQQISDT